MNEQKVIVPSRLRFKSAPTVDQQVFVNLDSKENEMNEYDRIATVNLAQLFDDERQASETFRPTFKISPIYNNVFTGTTDYIPFRNNLFFVENERSLLSGVWKGYPQYYEFEFFRPDVKDQHVPYLTKSAYTYNWTYYISYPHSNNFTQDLFWTDGIEQINWVAADGIPFIIKNIEIGGTNYISCKCIAEHNLFIGDYVEFNFGYNGKKYFQVNALGDGTFGSDLYIFNLLNIGYTGSTFDNGKKGTFKRILDITNSAETKSTYYVKMHKIVTNVDDIIVTKTGFEESPFNANKKFQFSSLTPDNQSKITQKSSSLVYSFTLNYDLNVSNVLDNQKRPLNEIFLTIVNKGYTGYFNKPYQTTGVKQGWEFNITNRTNVYWNETNLKSNANIPYSSYTLTSGSTETFYYNQDLKSGDTMCGDYCEWNNFLQQERVISSYYHKIKYNQEVFKSESTPTTNPKGFYYQPHVPMTIRAFSNYVESGSIVNADQVPFWSYFSQRNQSFYWRDIYSYGFIDEQNNGVNFPFLNFAHYPFTASSFKIIPDGGYVTETGLIGTGPRFGPLSGFSINTETVVTKPLIDECE